MAPRREQHDDALVNQSVIASEKEMVKGANTGPGENEVSVGSIPGRDPDDSEGLSRLMDLAPLDIAPLPTSLPGAYAGGGFTSSGLGSPATSAERVEGQDVDVEDYANSGHLIEATLVEEGPPVSGEPPATVPLHSDAIFDALPVRQNRANSISIGLLVVAAVVVIIVGIALSVRSKDVGSFPNGAATTATSTLPPEPNPSSTLRPTAAPTPTLERVQREGVLRCGVQAEGLVDLLHLLPGKENTFESDICRAIAASVMGRDNYNVELVQMPLASRVEYLNSGKVDVLVAALSWTMDRDVYLMEDQSALGFSAVYSTISSGFGGKQQYVSCAVDNFKYIDECQDLRICVLNGTRFYDYLAPRIPGRQLKQVQRYDEFYPALKDGTCNVFASTFVNLNFLGMESQQSGEEFVTGKRYFTSEPLAIVTRKDDHKFTDFCKYVFLSLVAAEYHNITSKSVLEVTQNDSNDKNPQVRFKHLGYFGGEYKDMFIDSVGSVGNLGEIFAKRIDPRMLAREPINFVNNGSTGIIHSLPFGHGMNQGLPLDLRFDEIWKRGKIRCAIRTFGRPGFASRVEDNTQSAFVGMDVDYCLAVGASIFTTPLNSVAFVEVQSSVDGFRLLYSGKVDVLAGVMGDFEHDVNDTHTGTGFSFTTPYFYNGSTDGAQRDPDANFCLATREDNSGWSEFVFWIVQATFYAEEENITTASANEMPIVNIYGESFRRLFRDAISAVGNHGEIYERNVQSHIPRQGLNMLHDKSNPTPLFYIPPGLLE